MTTNTEARLSGQQTAKEGTTRTIWHPYTDDTIRVDVTGDKASDIVGALYRLGHLPQNRGLSGQQERDLDYAIARKREVNWPWFGCIRYETPQLYKQPRNT